MVVLTFLAERPQDRIVISIYGDTSIEISANARTQRLLEIIVVQQYESTEAPVPSAT